MRAIVAKEQNVLSYSGNADMPVFGRDGLLIKVDTACICNGSDPAILSGGTRSEFPCIFGHEGCGRIVRAGEDTKGFQEGDRVVWWFTMGAFAEYVCVNPGTTAVIRIPDEVPDTEAPIFELVMAAFRAVAAAQPREKRVLIAGLGPSGLIMAQLCRCLGAAGVSGIDLYENRLNLGIRYGCEAVMGTYDVVIDAFGKDKEKEGQGLNRALELLKPGGRIVFYGHPVNGRVINSWLIQSRQLEMRIPSNEIEFVRELGNKAVKFYREGKLNLSGLVTDVIELNEVPEYLERLEKEPEKHIKIIVRIS